MLGPTGFWLLQTEQELPLDVETAAWIPVRLPGRWEEGLQLTSRAQPVWERVRGTGGLTPLTPAVTNPSSRALRKVGCIPGVMHGLGTVIGWVQEPTDGGCTR